MSPGDPVLWIDRAGAERHGHYIATYGGRLIIEFRGAKGPELRYVDPKDVRPANPITPERRGCP